MSDERGDVPAKLAEENGTEVVSGNTDDNQTKKDTSQDVTDLEQNENILDGGPHIVTSPTSGEADTSGSGPLEQNQNVEPVEPISGPDRDTKEAPDADPKTPVANEEVTEQNEDILDGGPHIVTSPTSGEADISGSGPLEQNQNVEPVEPIPGPDQDPKAAPDADPKTPVANEEVSEQTISQHDTVQETKDGTVTSEAAMETVSLESDQNPDTGSSPRVTEDAEKTKELVIEERPVSISLCTSAYSFNVEGLVSYLKSLMEENPKLIKEVKVHVLPYNDIDHYKFPVNDPVDVMILCHSINNRRFAITDVMDALYDEYLPYCARVVGKEKMGVIVHDFDDMRETVQSSRMSSFKYKQPKAFETTSLQITCGHIEKEEQVLKQMVKADRDKIVRFLEHASEYPEEMQKEENKWTESFMSFISKMPSFGFGSSGGANESNIPTPKPEQKNDGTSVDPQPESTVGGDSKPDPPRGTSPETPQSSGAVHATAASGTEGAIDLPSQQNMTQNSGRVFASASSYATPRRISVSVCSSAYKRNVKGLLSWFAKFQAEQSHMITDVRFRQLPYNDIDSFRFPQNDPVDVMVLCHSVDNRGFSITNVENAIYEKYLKYCNKLIGKKKLAVIVHDFADCKPAIVESRMESFRRMQKLTFELVDTVIICGSLEESDKLGIRNDDETRLIHFLEFARFEQKENLKQSLLGKLF